MTVGREVGIGDGRRCGVRLGSVAPFRAVPMPGPADGAPAGHAPMDPGKQAA